MESAGVDKVPKLSLFFKWNWHPQQATGHHQLTT
jgi:hypothetical protein